MYDHVLALSDALKTYYTADELRRMADHYRVDLESDYEGPNCSALAESLLTQPDLGRNKEFLSAIVSSLENRIDRAIANTDWERRTFHQSMWPRVKPIIDALKTDSAPKKEIAIPPTNPFTAKAEVRDLLQAAKTPIIVVDNYIGLGTLDCLRDVRVPIQLLTGSEDRAIEKDFGRHLKEFAAEGRTIEIRRHPQLHDRYIILNKRCWLIGSSLKDAGKKTFSMIEAVDTYETIKKDVEQKWKESTPYNP
jgi:hypothetical protein